MVMAGEHEMADALCASSAPRGDSSNEALYALTSALRATALELEVMVPCTSLRQWAPDRCGMAEGLGWIVDYLPWILVALMYDEHYTTRPPQADGKIAQESSWVGYGLTGMVGTDVASPRALTA